MSTRLQLPRLWSAAGHTSDSCKQRYNKRAVSRPLRLPLTRLLECREHASQVPVPRRHIMTSHDGRMEWPGTLRKRAAEASCTRHKRPIGQRCMAELIKPFKVVLVRSSSSSLSFKFNWWISSVVSTATRQWRVWRGRSGQRQTVRHRSFRRVGVWNCLSNFLTYALVLPNRFNNKELFS